MKPTDYSQQELEKLLTQWSDNYYNGESKISDLTFDQFKDYLTQHYPQSSFLKQIGAPPQHTSTWEKVKHTIPMSSLDKVNSFEEVQKWLNSLTFTSTTTGLPKKITELWLSEKIDGISLELIYENSKLKEAITRGDGKIGEAITTNIRSIPTIPKVLAAKFTGAIRGELYFKKTKFSKLDVTKEDGDKYNNPRNAVSGIARRFDGKGAKFLDFLAYDLISYTEEIKIPSEEVKIATLKKLGFPTLDGYKVTLEKAKEVFEDYNLDKRVKLDYEIDGLVLKVNDLEAVEVLEQATKEDGNPKTQRAWKFAADSKITILREIIFSGGKSGVFTPIAVLDPVELVGATVKMASLHNISVMEELNVAPGDSVVVVRANDVIPQVISVDTKRNHNPVELPTNCQFCNSTLELVENKKKDRTIKTLHCLNRNCPKQKSGQILKFIEALELKDFSESRIDILFEAGLIKDAGDLFTFDRKKAAELEGFGDRLLEKLDLQLQALKAVPFERALGALGIISIGVKHWKKLIEAGHDSWQKIEQLLTLTKEQFTTELSKIKGIGTELSSLMYHGLIDSKELIPKLKTQLGIKQKTVGSLNGAYCLTGFRTYKDQDIEALIEAKGGTIKSGVSKNLTALLVVDGSSSSTKTLKAKELGVPILPIAEFYEQHLQ